MHTSETEAKGLDRVQVWTSSWSFGDCEGHNQDLKGVHVEAVRQLAKQSQKQATPSTGRRLPRLGRASGPRVAPDRASFAVVAGPVLGRAAGPRVAPDRASSAVVAGPVLSVPARAFAH